MFRKRAEHALGRGVGLRFAGGRLPAAGAQREAFEVGGGAASLARVCGMDSKLAAEFLVEGIFAGELAEAGDFFRFGSFILPQSESEAMSAASRRQPRRIPSMSIRA